MHNKSTTTSPPTKAHPIPDSPKKLSFLGTGDELDEVESGNVSLGESVGVPLGVCEKAILGQTDGLVEGETDGI